MFFIVGLGNPGAEYESTRHNVGFMLVDRLAEASGIRFKRAGRAAVGKGSVAGAEVMLIKPLTYMNLSGVAVSELAATHGVPAGFILAAYDDCDLPLGRIRLRKEGGSGGHKGIESISGCLSTTEYPRMRLGIGRPSSGGAGGLKDYVLTEFTPGESQMVEDMLKRGVEAVEAFIREGIEAAMNRFNAAV